MSRKPPIPYSPYGSWAKHAAKIRTMVENDGWGVSDAVRRIVARQRYKDPDKAFRGIRAAYYELRKRVAREGEEGFEI